MASKPFRFKQFSVWDDLCTHKVGTDAVLLGSWVRLSKDDQALLDVGTGSGVIALMLAQRTSPDATVDAIELQKEDALQAESNARLSPWPEKIRVTHTSLQAYFPGKVYDVVVSNPPYFIRSLLPPGQRRTLARHAETLSFEELLDGVCRLLAPHGRFSVILPVVEGKLLIQLASDRNLRPIRTSEFCTRVNKSPERIMIEFSRIEREVERSEIILYGEKDDWSDQYKSLTRDFYLKA